MKKDKIGNEEKMFRREERLNLLADRTMLPKEIISGCCSISVMEYQPERVVILTKQCRVEVSGKHLEIQYYAKDEMKITGSIEAIFYKNCR